MPGFVCSHKAIVSGGDMGWLDSLLLQKLKEQTGREDRQEKTFISTAYVNGIKAGGIVARRLFESCYIDLLAVVPDFRSHGIGTRLLERLEQECRNEGIGTLFLNTQDFQAPNFYEQNGFERIGEMKDVPFKGTIRIFFVKRIDLCHL